MSDRPEDPGLSGGEPPTSPPPPPPPPTAPGTVDLRSETAVRSGGIAGRVVAGAVGAVLLVGGVAFAATQMGNDGGASDPEAAVQEMFDALADEDVLGLLATLDPGERDAISGPVERLFEELERLEVLDDSFDLGGVDGIDLEFEDLTFRSEPVRDDLVRVHLTGGTASFAVDTDEIPIGDFLVDTFDRFGVEYRGIQESDSEAIDPDQTGDTFIVARDTGDGWRISLGYTAVEAARLDSGAPVPAAGAGLTPIGADSPEEAVEGFLQAAVAIDVEGAVARLSPSELRAVHDYWPVLVDDADLPSADDVDAAIELTDLELRSTTDGNRGLVFVDSIGIDVVTDDFEGGGTIADGCLEVRGDVRESFEDEDIDLPEGPICRDDLEQIIEDATAGTGDLGMGFGGLGDLSFDDRETPTLGITVVRVDGGWFVAPFGTFADVGLAMLEIVERDDLDAIVDAVEEFFDSFAGGFSGGFEDFDDFSGGFEDYDDFEMYDDFSGESSTEHFDDVGEPLFDDGFGQPGSAVDTSTETLLLQLLDALTGDARVTDCALGELYATARKDLLYELAEAYQYEYEPSGEAQDALFAALDLCGG